MKRERPRIGLPRRFFWVSGMLVLVVCTLTLFTGVAVLVQPELLRMARAGGEEITGRSTAWGSLLFIGAAALGAQTYRMARDGFVYCGRRAKVFRTDDPSLYRFWFALHSCFVAALFIWALAAFRL